MVVVTCSFCERQRVGYLPRYQITAYAARMAAFTILARMEAEREALA